MRRVYVTLLAAFMAAGFMTAQDFEGTITYQNDAADGAIPTLMIKDNMVRMDIEDDGQKIAMLSNPETGKITIMTEENGKKIAIIQDMKQMEQMAAQMGNRSDNDEDDFEITVTSETKMIDGYECKKVLGKNKDMEGTAWVCKDLNINYMDLFPTLKQSDPMHSTLLNEGFVMEYEAKDLKSGEVMKMTADVEEKSLSADMFVVPEDYMVMDMTNMMQLMKEAQSDPEKMKQLQEMMEQMKN